MKIDSRMICQEIAEAKTWKDRIRICEKEEFKQFQPYLMDLIIDEARSFHVRKERSGTGTSLPEKTCRELSKALLGKKTSALTFEVDELNWMKMKYPLNLNEPYTQTFKREVYPSTFDEPYKCGVRAKFGNRCVICGMTKEENGEALSVHHFDYNKESFNTISLCRFCHGETNGNRDHWEQYFRDFLKKVK